MLQYVVVRTSRLGLRNINPLVSSNNRQSSPSSERNKTNILDVLKVTWCGKNLRICEYTRSQRFELPRYWGGLPQPGKNISLFKINHSPRQYRHHSNSFEFSIYYRVIYLPFFSLDLLAVFSHAMYDTVCIMSILSAEFLTWSKHFPHSRNMSMSTALRAQVVTRAKRRDTQCIRWLICYQISFPPDTGEVQS